MPLGNVATFPTTFSYDDPLEDDRPGDIVVSVTRRALARLALVASETGARFEREGIAHDPMAWILAPRSVFGGQAALDASLELNGCTRAVLLHGLSLGLDAAPEDLDELIHGDDPEEVMISTPTAAVSRGCGTMAA